METVGGMSDMGQSVRLMTSACAKAELGDLKGARLDVEAFGALSLDESGNQQMAMICAGDADGAAALYVRSLRDPATRSAALAALDRMATPALHRPSEILGERYAAALRDRPDVQAEIAKVGRIETIDLRAL